MKKLLSSLKNLFSDKKAYPYEGTNAPLVQAMHVMAREDNRENRKKLYEALLASTLIIPTPELPVGFRAPGEKATGSNTRIDMIGVNDEHGRKVTPVFTDLDALKTWDPNTPSLGIKAQALFQMVMKTDFQAIVINPIDPIRKMIRPGGWVTRLEMDLLSQGIAPSRILKGSSIPNQDESNSGRRPTSNSSDSRGGRGPESNCGRNSRGFRVVLLSDRQSRWVSPIGSRNRDITEVGP